MVIQMSKIDWDIRITSNLMVALVSTLILSLWSILPIDYHRICEPSPEDIEAYIAVLGILSACLHGYFPIL